jgi:GNAT superfamily N-acetyltransferase
MIPLLQLEVAEIEAFTNFYRAAGPQVSGRCGLSVLSLEDGVLLAANRLDVLALNRLIGLGLERRPSDETLAGLEGAFRAAGSARFFVPVAPIEGSDLPERLDRLGIRHYNNWIRLRRGLDDIPEASGPGPAVREIGPEDADAFSEIVAAAFGYPPEIAPLTGATVGRPGWRHYLSYEGLRPIGAAAMYVAGEAAWFGFAGTDEAYRGRGSQTALVIRRMRDAADAGCRWVSVETAEQTPAKEAPSFRNLLRLGFTVAYRRPNHLWKRVD